MKKTLEITKDDEIWPSLKKFLDGKVTYKVMPGLSQFHILSDLVDSRGNSVDAIDPQTYDEIQGTRGKIQIDIFIGRQGNAAYGEISQRKIDVKGIETWLANAG